MINSSKFFDVFLFAVLNFVWQIIIFVRISLIIHILHRLGSLAAPHITSWPPRFLTTQSTRPDVHNIRRAPAVLTYVVSQLPIIDRLVRCVCWRDQLVARLQCYDVPQFMLVTLACVAFHARVDPCRIPVAGLGVWRAPVCVAYSSMGSTWQR